MFVGGLIVGFIYIWQLCLVIIALSPLIGFSGYFMAKTMSQIVTGQLESYAQAGAIAEESFALIRTVTAFGLQKDRIRRYEVELESAAAKTTKQGFATGMGFGFVMFFFFCSYAIAFWVGAVLVVNSKTDAQVTYPLPSPPPAEHPYCVVGGIVPPPCNPQGTNLTFETAADACGCPLCRCGCYYINSTTEFNYETSCTSGGDVILTFFSVLFGCFAIGQAAPR